MRGPGVFSVFKYVLLAGFAVFFLFPIYWLFLTSFKSQSAQFTMPPVWWTSDWITDYYRGIFLDGAFPEMAWNSVVVASCSTLVSLVAGTMGAYSLSRFRLP